MKTDLTDPQQLRYLLKKYGLWAKKRLGQNFLIDRSVLTAMVESADLQADDVVVEIGPGPGVLTRELLPRTKKVFAVEIDESILPVLKETTHFFRDRLEIIQGHVLNFTPPDGMYKLVANIPYYLTSPILRHFLLESNNPPASLTLMVQKEVAERIADKTRQSVLSLIVSVAGEAEIRRIVPASCFFPPPKVDSAILHIRVASRPKTDLPLPVFFKVVKMGFSAPRKKLKNNLPANILSSSGIDSDLRAENLTIPDWELLTRAFLDFHKQTTADKLY